MHVRIVLRSQRIFRRHAIEEWHIFVPDDLRVAVIFLHHNDHMTRTGHLSDKQCRNQQVKEPEFASSGFHRNPQSSGASRWLRRGPKKTEACMIERDGSELADLT